MAKKTPKRKKKVAPKAPKTPKAKSSSSSLKSWQKNLLTHGGILILFYIIVVGYFRPIVFDGQVVRQHDIINYQGMAKETVDFRMQTGDEALWTTRLFSGMPTYQTSTRYTGNIFYLLDKYVFRFGLPRPANYVFITFAGFYLLLLVCGLNPWISALGAAAYSLSSYFFIIHGPGHTSKANAIAYMAPVIAGIILTYQGRLLLGGVITAFFLAMEIYTNHLQITYFLAIMIAGLGISYAINSFRENTMPAFLKASGVLLIAALIGVGPNIAKLWTTSEYASETTRGKSELPNAEGKLDSGLDLEYAFRWSYDVPETLTLMIANSYGGASNTVVDDKDFLRANNISQREVVLPTYWGSQQIHSTAGPVYVGALICFLFVLGLFLVNSHLKWWLLALTLLSFMMSWGRNFMGFNEFLFNYLPIYNKFRAPAMLLVIAEFTMPLLAALGLREVFMGGYDKKKIERSIYIAAGLTAGLSLIFALVPDLFFSFSGPGDFRYLEREGGQAYIELTEAYRLKMFTADAWRTFGFIAAGAGLLWLYVKDIIKNRNLVFIGLAAIILIDMIPVNRRYLNDDNFEKERNFYAGLNPSQADSFILQDKDPNYRVINIAVNPWNEAITSYHHKSVGGYHAAKLGRYRDMISKHLDTERVEFINLIQSQPADSVFRAGMSRLQVLNMLNTRYLIINPNARPVQNPSAMGNAWFVSNIQKVNSPLEEINALNNFDPRRTAVVDQQIFGGDFGQQLEGLSPTNDPSARITLTEFAPNRLVYESNSQAEGLGVFSEIYYDRGKGWQAYIDGQPVPHMRANYILRALRIPAGKHQIEFKFEPSSYFVGNNISLFFSILLWLGIVYVVYLELKKRGVIS
ncbi:MAG: YfhO family protein [Bacteroidota bacterium]